MIWLPVTGTLGTAALTAVATLAALPPASIEALDPARRPAPQEVVVDTVGERAVVTTQFPAPDGDAGGWSLVEELRLGKVVSDGPEGFGNIHDLTVDRAGRIYVLDVGSKEVRVFGRDGAHLRSMVRDGEGPGEMRYRGGFGRRITWRAPGQLWISGGQQQMVIDTLGNELRRTAGRRYPGMFFPGEVPSSSSVIAAGTGGSIFSVVDVTVTRSPEDIGVRHTSVVRSSVSGDYEMLPGDTLAIETRNMVVIGANGEPRANRRGSTISVRRVMAENPRFVWTVEQDGTLWLAHRARYRFDKLTFERDTIRTIRMGHVPPLPTEELDFVPVLAALASSPEGWLWVQREAPGTEGGSKWDVLDNCGRYRATVSVPVSLRSVEVGAAGQLYGVSSDDLGIDFVHRFRVRSEVGTPIAREVCPF